MRCLCRIHKSNEALDITANPYIFKNFNHIGYAKTQMKEEQRFQEEIKKTEYNLKQAAAEAKTIVDSANEHADKIIKNAGQEANMMMNKAVMDGYQKGFASAKSEINLLISKVKQNSENLIGETKQKTDSIFNEFESNAMEISLEIAKKVLDVELDRNDSAIVSVIKNAVGKIKNEAQAKVILHEEDLQKIENTEAFITLKEQNKENLQFSSDKNMKKGDVLIHTEGEIIDAGVNSQFINIKNAVLQGI